jgi:hypothetical protein
MDTPRHEPNSGKRSQGWRLVKVVLILGGLFVIALASLFLGIGIFQELRPVAPPPADLASVEAFLAAEAPAARRTPPGPKLDLPTTATAGREAAPSEAAPRGPLVKLIFDSAISEPLPFQCSAKQKIV